MSKVDFLNKIKENNLKNPIFFCSLNKVQKKYTKQEKYSDYWKKLRIEKSKSTDELINKDFKKYDEKKLKDKFLYFDKNYTDILRHKNWWKINK